MAMSIKDPETEAMLRELAAVTGESITTAVRTAIEQRLRPAQEAYQRFGKDRHPASLNFGDCISYALAHVCDEALLLKGDDFALTDIRPAGASR